jgi:Protein of unknown function (DUF2568)
MFVVKALSQLLAFLVELAMLTAYGYWGYHAFDSVILKWGLVILAPLLAIIVWGAWLAPNNTHRLGMPWLLLAKIILFGLGALGLYLVHQHHYATWFTGLCVASLLLMAITNDF